jgi:ABC-type antimicrobial peptide transport system permease subunit
MLLVIVFGVLAGIVAGLLGGRYVESQLFGVKAADLQVFAISIAAVLAASVGAALIPSWRASRLDPARALRHE